MIDLSLTVSEVKSAYLLEHIVPKLPAGLDIEDVCGRLRDNGDLVPLVKEGYIWKGFKNIPDDDEEYTPTITSGIINGIVSGLIRVAEEMMPSLPPSTLIYQADEEQPCWAERDVYTNPTSGLALRVPSDYRGAKEVWYNTGVTLSLESHRDDEYYNVDHIMKCMAQMMSADRCRRYTYGIHVTDSTMHVWFASRCSILVSYPIDLNDDYKTVAKIFLSFIYASKADLGWDTTVSVDIIDSQRTYTIDVSGAKLLTTSLMTIHNDRACQLLGAGTRICKAYKLEDGEKTDVVVLKDLWLEDDRKTELDIRRQILEDISDAEDREYVDGHLLTPMACERVRVGGVQDHPETVIHYSKPPGNDYYDFPYTKEDRKYFYDYPFRPFAYLPPWNPYAKNAARYEPKVKYPYRYHYRIVYKEKATPFGELKNSKDILTVLIDVLETLLRINAAGWVHRDISTGNVYLYEDPITGEKRGMLGDLEFATKADPDDDDTTKNVGTRGFTALEVQCQGYLFRPQVGRKRKRQKLDNGTRLLEELDRNMNGGENQIKFCYNYIHDVESIWWLAVWALFSFEKAPGGPYWEDEVGPRSGIALRISYKRKFINEERSTVDRVNFLREVDFDTYTIRCTPTYFKGFRTALSAVRRVIKRTYKENETDETKYILFDDQSSDVHIKFLEALRRVKMDEFEIVRLAYKNG